MMFSINVVVKKMKTVYKCYFEGNLENVPSSLLYIKAQNGGIILGDKEMIKEILFENKIKAYYFEMVYQNALFEYFDNFPSNVRIEKGAIIRDGVTLKDGAIILMNATINKDAIIGENTMIDMNAVVGSSAVIGNNTHIGAGAVISGVMEPASKTPVIIGNNVFVGALSVILEGVEIEDDAVVGAGSVVTKNVKRGEVVWGVPARVMKKREELEDTKVDINKKLRF